MRLLGVQMDKETRCKHYHAEIDRIAIRFPCCNTYYPCYECHEELADHPATPIPKEEWDLPGILCGSCLHTLTVHEYMACDSKCPSCQAAFNPGCKLHAPIYFEMERA